MSAVASNLNRTYRNDGGKSILTPHDHSAYNTLNSFSSHVEDYCQYLLHSLLDHIHWKPSSYIRTKTVLRRIPP